MGFVKECPKKEADVIKSSNMLNCGTDHYGNNQYICVPNKDKSSLVELCYNGTMGLKEKGNCIEESGGRLISYNCSKFRTGCPGEDFDLNTVYKYPACQMINTQLHCYVMDPSCQTVESIKGRNGIVLCLWLGGLVAVLIIAVIMLYLLRKSKCNCRKKENPLLKTDAQLEQLNPKTQEAQLEQLNPKTQDAQLEQLNPKTQDAQLEQLNPKTQEAQLEQLNPKTQEAQLEQLNPETQDAQLEQLNPKTQVASTYVPPKEQRPYSPVIDLEKGPITHLRQDGDGSIQEDGYSINYIDHTKVPGNSFGIIFSDLEEVHVVDLKLTQP